MFIGPGNTDSGERRNPGRRTGGCKIRLSDRNSDALQLSVVQHGDAFCHLDRSSCFGELVGLAALEKILQPRLESVPKGLYTARLFNDSFSWRKLASRVKLHPRKKSYSEQGISSTSPSRDVWLVALAWLTLNAPSTPKRTRSRGEKVAPNFNVSAPHQRPSNPSYRNHNRYLLHPHHLRKSK